MGIRIGAIFLMTILIAGFSSFPSSMSNSSPEFADQTNSLNLINIAFADSDKEEKAADKAEKATERAADKAEKAAEREAVGTLEENDDIQEFSSDTVTHLSSKTTICHKPGTPAEKTKQIPEAALNGHFGHGDVSGDCSDTDLENIFSKKEMKRTEKELKLSERAEMLIQKLEQRIIQLEKRLQTLLDKVESGEYYGTLSNVDTVKESHSISFDGTATSIHDESVTSELSGEIFIENLMTGSDTSKFRVTGGEIIVGNNIYDAAFGKVRVSSLGVSGEKDSMVVIIQTFDSEDNDNTIKLTLLFDSAIEADLGTEPLNFEIKPNSKISKQWFLSGSGTISLE